MTEAEDDVTDVIGKSCAWCLNCSRMLSETPRTPRQVGKPPRAAPISFWDLIADSSRDRCGVSASYGHVNLCLLESEDDWVMLYTTLVASARPYEAKRRSLGPAHLSAELSRVEEPN